jgi:DNA (cytosine-5)-methyltransferase 1
VNYYNDNDPSAAAWLRELIKQKLIPAGDVDERSIADVTKADLEGYTQCHFFAGIGGWSEALRLAGWPTTRPVWTGSCPCQPFSSAGKRQGTKDERHLWPEFYRLIRECRPVTVFGEQVERAIGLGWLDGVFADLEAENYTCGAAVLGAHSVNAPHIRQRLYWVADAQHDGHDRPRRNEAEQSGNREDNRLSIGGGSELCGANGMADTNREYDDGSRSGSSDDGREREQAEQIPGFKASGMDDTKSLGRGILNTPDIRQTNRKINPSSDASDLQSFWSNSIWLPCKDGKARRISPEPAFFPLADGLPGRVAMLRGFGNAIVPQVAAEFVRAYMEVRNDHHQTG